MDMAYSIRYIDLPHVSCGKFYLLLGELALQVLVAPSLVAPGKGLFLCIYDDDDGGDAEESGAVEEIIIPQGMYV